MPAIETTGLTKRFGDVTAVDELELSVASGEVFGFLGPNGAGKSTTINMLLGFLEPTAGRATVLRHDVTADSLAARERIGVLPEGFAPYERLIAREHVAYAGSLKDVTPDTEALLRRVGLDEDACDRPAGNYSKGMGQRLALATALVGDPELLILDEPSSGLDPEGMAEMRELIRTEAERGTAVFFSSHILSEVDAVCDRVGILSDGSLSAVGRIDDLREQMVDGASMEVTVAEVPAELEATLRGLEKVRAVRTDDDAVHAEVTAPKAKMEVLRQVDAHTDVQDIVSEEASLESVFEQYTTDGGRETESDTDPDATSEQSAEVQA